MQTNPLMDRLHVRFSWIARLAYLNGLWLVFSLGGAVLFGAFPATAAMLTICRKWLHGDEEFSVYQTFVKAVKRYFWQANLLGWLLTAAGLLLYLNFLVLRSTGAAFGIIYVAAFYVTVFFYIVTVVNAFPLFIHYPVSVFRCVKHAFLIGVLHSHRSMAMVVSGSAFYYLMFSFPAAALFFLGSVIAMLQMWLALSSYKKIDGKSGQMSAGYAVGAVPAERD
ncbi:Uncharacterized membrane protein YesL [Evansella caseinilytica]|uniref:Uncharacterized membrane protein YesL n=1 Tax=Evansella caseinilytica TaxID=1503961 RepID=A0A1H3TD70_9BACI|nr:DUF624 domain-containing protein [Evansella caseinilytica]SDZ47828.1 Uncharacterized membrane protein YesL [Evansella caseinilytica]